MATDSLASAWRAVLLSRLQLTTRRSGLNLRKRQIIVQEQRLAVRVDQLSVYVTGGGGTHLEPRIASHYLAALIAEAGARGVLGTVVAVKTQQSEIDAPLDDLVSTASCPTEPPRGLTCRLPRRSRSPAAMTSGPTSYRGHDGGVGRRGPDGVRRVHRRDIPERPDHPHVRRASMQYPSASHESLGAPCSQALSLSVHVLA